MPSEDSRRAWENSPGDGRGRSLAGRAPRCYAIKRTFWKDKRYICTLPAGHNDKTSESFDGFNDGHYDKNAKEWFLEPTSDLVDVLYDNKLLLGTFSIAAFLCAILAAVEFLGGAR